MVVWRIVCLTDRYVSLSQSAVGGLPLARLTWAPPRQQICPDLSLLTQRSPVKSTCEWISYIVCLGFSLFWTTQFFYLFQTSFTLNLKLVAFCLKECFCQKTEKLSRTGRPPYTELSQTGDKCIYKKVLILRCFETHLHCVHTGSNHAVDIAPTVGASFTGGGLDF